MFFKLSITHEFKYKYRLTANLCCHHYCISISNYLWEKKCTLKKYYYSIKVRDTVPEIPADARRPLYQIQCYSKIIQQNFGAAQEMNLLCLQHHLQMIFYLFFRFVFHTFAFCSYMTHITSKN